AGLLATILFTRVGRLEALALGTIAGGGIGNGIERLAGTGVVDFIKVNYPWGGSWPLFNVADVLIVVGVALLFLLPKNKKKREASGAPASWAEISGRRRPRRGRPKPGPPSKRAARPREGNRGRSRAAPPLIGTDARRVAPRARRSDASARRRRG